MNIQTPNSRRARRIPKPLLLLLIQAPYLISCLSPRKFVSRISNKASNFLGKASIKNLSVPLPNKNSIRIVSHEEQVNGADLSLLKTENTLLRDAVRQLEVENELLKQKSNKLVLETFEGEGKLRESSKSKAFVNATFGVDPLGITLSGAELEQDTNMWCDELEEGKKAV